MFTKLKVETDMSAPDILKKFVDQALQTEKPCLFEFKHEDQYFLFNTAPILSERYVNFYTSDITELKRLQHEMIKARDEAEQANHAKSEFLARMSHELRTPMNAILGFTQLMEMDDIHPLTDYQLADLTRISTAGLHLLNLINEILDLSKIESGAMELALEPVDLTAVVDEVISISEPLTKKNNITLKSPQPLDNHRMIMADALRLKQVIWNLISNAIKYNKPHGSLTISYEKKDNGMLRLGIKDTGIGIPQDEKDKIFKPFERIFFPGHDAEGTGIGLSISKNLVEMMNGTINFESAIGVGSFFYIEFPLLD